MGMAASQARYLALVARKSNCEYEGQQINQARLLLSNQSANLFNQMLGLNVPVPPSTQDFTKTQYSYADGTHTYVIDNWRQLSVTDPDYNYIVTSHCYTDIYTGSMKRMADPQVQISHPGTGIASLAQIETARAALRAAQDEMTAKYNNWQSVKAAQEVIIAGIEANALTNIGYNIIDGNVTAATNPGGGNTYNITGDNNYTVTFGGNAQRVLDELKNMLNLNVISLDDFNAKLMAYNPDYYINDISELDYDGGELTEKQQNVLNTFGLSTQGSNQYILYRKDLDQIVSDIAGGAEHAQLGGYKIAGTDFTTPAQYWSQVEDCNAVIAAAKASYDAAKDIYEEKNEYYQSLAQPTYIGNCPLTYLDQLTESQEIELQQVVRDMIAQGINTDIINCFDTDGNYLGGVYSFNMYGTTYYTTYQNLLDAYASNIHSNNFIDDQYKMPYYNASYISTRVDQESRALLETDGNGRFTTIRFENDSATYALNMETITDEAAYQDAMNQYYYENAQYDKMVQDINAKTSIIQKEDQQLELRLKQLDTERNALSNEIDAVSKVVKDNVEASFKTFGG